MPVFGHLVLDLVLNVTYNVTYAALDNASSDAKGTCSKYWDFVGFCAFLCCGFSLMIVHLLWKKRSRCGGPTRLVEQVRADFAQLARHPMGYCRRVPPTEAAFLERDGNEDQAMDLLADLRTAPWLQHGVLVILLAWGFFPSSLHSMVLLPVFALGARLQYQMVQRLANTTAAQPLQKILAGEVGMVGKVAAACWRCCFKHYLFPGKIFVITIGLSTFLAEALAAYAVGAIFQQDSLLGSMLLAFTLVSVSTNLKEFLDGVELAEDQVKASKAPFTSDDFWNGLWRAAIAGHATLLKDVCAERQRSRSDAGASQAVDDKNILAIHKTELFQHVISAMRVSMKAGALFAFAAVEGADTDPVSQRSLFFAVAFGLFNIAKELPGMCKRRRADRRSFRQVVFQTLLSTILMVVYIRLFGDANILEHLEFTASSVFYATLGGVVLVSLFIGSM